MPALIATAVVLAGLAAPFRALTASGALSLSSGTGISWPASAVLASSVCGSAAGGDYQVATDGRVFTFGCAQFAGSMAGQHLNMPVVGGAAPASGGCPGPQGVAGPQGAPGFQGAASDRILSGTTAPPASTLGTAGDFYLGTSSPETLRGPKTSTGWPATSTSLVGPQGPAGVAGIKCASLQTVTVGANAESTVYATCPSGSDEIAPQWSTPGTNTLLSVSGAVSSFEWEFGFINHNSNSEVFSCGVVCAAQVG